MIGLLNEMATNWREVFLRDVSRVKYGKGLRAEDRKESGSYPVYASSGVVGSHDEAYAQGPSIVIGRKGSVGTAHYVPTAFWPIDTTFYLDDVSPFLDLQYLTAAIRFFGLERYKLVVGVPGINRTDLEGFKFPLPPLSEQRRIVEILQESEQIRRLRAQAEAKTAQLIPAVFRQIILCHEDRERWDVSTVGDLAADKPNSIRTGPFGSDLLHSEFVDEGIPVLGIDNVVTNRFRWAERRYITAAKYRDLHRYRVFPGDVMVTIMGTVGRSCVAPDELGECISTKHLCVITLDKAKVRPGFLWATLLYDPAVHQQTRAVGRGAIMEGWNATIVKRLRLPLPPLDIQDAFESVANEALSGEPFFRETGARGDRLSASLTSHAFAGTLTAVWRSRREAELVQEAAERDRWLTDAGVSAARAPVADRKVVRVGGIECSDLSRNQTLLVRDLQELMRDEQVAGEWITAASLSKRTNGRLRGNPRAMAADLDVLAARGLVISASQEQEDPMTGEVNYGMAYRVPRDQGQETADEDATLRNERIRLAEMERLSESIVRERTG